MTGSGREVLKWFALLCMVIDHLNAIVLDHAYPWMSAVGRLAFPIFAFVLAYNVSCKPDGLPRAIKRLCLFGCIAWFPHNYAFGLGLLPLNILFTFSFGLGVVYFLDRRQWLLAAWLGLTGAFLVDYGPAGIALVIASYLLCQKDSWERLSFFLFAVIALCQFNGNGYAFFALPVLWWVGNREWSIPRLRWAFYTFYPSHFLGLLVVAQLLR